jgi:hypothetical protein
MAIIRQQLPGQPSLQPAAQPVNTFARPKAPLSIPDAGRRTDLLYLADALSGINPALAQFGQAYMQQSKEAATAAAEKLTQETTRAELDKRIRSGDIPPEVSRAALDLAHGEETARLDFEDIKRRYLGENTSQDPTVNNAFDREHGNIDQFWSDVFREKEGNVAPSSRPAWTRFMADAQQALYGEHNQFVAARTKDYAMDTAGGQLYGVMSDAIGAGDKDPVVIRQKMQDAFKTVKGLYQLTPQEADKAMFSTARSIAEQGIPGNPDLGPQLVREILLDPRGGVGPIGLKAEFAHDSNVVIELATKKAGELKRELQTNAIVSFESQAHEGKLDKNFDAWVAANPHVLSQERVESIKVANNSALQTAKEQAQKTVAKLQLKAQADTSEEQVSHALQIAGDNGTLGALATPMKYLKENGEESSYQPEGLQTRAIQEYMARADAQQKLDEANGIPQEAAVALRVARDVDWFGKNGVINPSWKATLNAGFAAASPSALAQGQPPAILMQSVKLYEDLAAKAPGLLDRHLGSDNAKDFYMVYETMKGLGRFDERQALEAAAVATKDVADPATWAPANKEVEAELHDVTAGWRKYVPWTSGVGNFGDMKKDLSRLAKVMVRAGLDPTKALEEAGKQLATHYTNINGFMVKTSDRNIEGFGAALKQTGAIPRPFADVVRDYLAQYDGEHTPADGLSIRKASEGSGTWFVIDAAHGFPVHSRKDLPTQFSLRELVKFEADRQSVERLGKTIELTKENYLQQLELKQHPRKPGPTFKWN